MEHFTTGQEVSLRTQSVEHADDTFHIHYYEHWNGILACEGWETVTLTEYEAEGLNKYGSFSR